MIGAPCSKCGAPVGPTGRRGLCSACKNKQNAAWKRKNPEKAKASQRAADMRWRARHPEKCREHHWKKSGIAMTSVEYDRLLEAQGGKCAICRSDKPGGPGKFFHVDHDHTYLHVRGLLCTLCNSAIAFFNDSPHLLRAALKYLDEHRPQLKLATK